MTPTTVRQHPTFVKNVFLPDSIAILPPRVIVNRLVFDGNHHRLTDRETEITKTIQAELPLILQEKGYLVRLSSLADSSTSDIGRFELNQVLQRYSSLSDEMYQKFTLEKPKAFSMEKSLGPMVNQFSEREDVDALAIVRYYEFEESEGLQTKEFFSDILSSALTGEVVHSADRGAAVEIAIINGFTGDVLWTNIDGGNYDCKAILQSTLEQLPPRKSTHIVREDIYNKVQQLKDRMESIGVLKITCNKPYRLDRDCSSFSGPRRKIKIDNITLRISGSEDGKVVLLMGPNRLDLDSFQAHEGRLETVVAILAGNGMKVKSLIEITYLKKICGYFLELDQDGYSILEKYAI